MRVLLTTIGSAGDVRPFVWMARTLDRAGHDATVMVPEYFRPLVESFGVRCRALPIDMDPRQITERPECMARFRGTGVVLKEMLFPHYPLATREAMDEIERTSPDLVLHHQIMLPGAWAAEKLGVPAGCVAMAPTSWPSLVDPNRYPSMPDRDVYRSWIVRLGLSSAHVIAGMMFDPVLNRHRATFGLPRQKRIITEASLDAAVNIGMWSAVFRGRASDDPYNAHIVGFPFLDDADEAWARTDERVRSFVEAGDPPVLVTLGSTASLLRGDTHQQLADACMALGRRAIVLAPEVSAPRESEDVLVVSPGSATPHAGIMPRCAGSIVHGGIGTTSEALRSGNPVVIVPHAHDQFDNARRVRLMGAGATLAKKRLGTPGAIDVIRGALESCGEEARTAKSAILLSDADREARFVCAVESAVSGASTPASARATSADPSCAARSCATE